MVTFKTFGVVLVIDLPHKAILAQQFVGWMLEIGK